MRENKEDICKEAKARHRGQVEPKKGEKGDGEDEERARVHPHLPLFHSANLEDALVVANRNGLACLLIRTLADQTSGHSHHKHRQPTDVSTVRKGIDLKLQSLRKTWEVDDDTEGR